MPQPTTPPPRPTTSRARNRVIAIFFILFVGLSVALSVRLRESRAIDALNHPTPTTQPGAPSTPPHTQPALLAATLRDLRLVTVRIDHLVTTSAASSSWRGGVLASVSANATTLFGVDLSRLADSDISVNPLTGAVSIRVPEPARIATEITTPADQQSTKVDVGWARLRDISGEYYLGLARARLHEAAREQLLSDDQRAQVRALSREQLARLVRALTPDHADADITFTPAGEVDGGAGVPPAVNVRP